jgi:D-alanyl-lipoteichoic acid acyltransferase DltB (MBOAT superfamily)
MVFKPIYIFILAFTIVIDYYAGIAIQGSQTKSRKKTILTISIAANVGILIIFKYWNFLAENVNTVLSIGRNATTIPLLEILLPIGLSFHTFQAMSYTIEVYRGNQRAERHFGLYALYVMFYPQLVAGPIERPQNVLPQFHKKIEFSYANIKTGLILILIGLFKKVFIADRLGSYVDAYYENIEYLTFIPTVSAMVFYSFQIYCDFSGYSSIALGSAKCLGYSLMTNFNKPYQAQSVTEFWRRWHISLSTWFRDYVYIPLGGNRGKTIHTIRNLSIVFLLSGIWHGASWTFIAWGSLHALFLIIENQFSFPAAISKRPARWRSVYVFGWVTIAWVFFRANDFNQAFEVFQSLLNPQLEFSLTQLSAFISPLNLALCWLCIPLVFYIDNTRMSIYRKHLLTFLVIGTLLIIVLGKSNENAFIYFQF